MTLQKSLEEQLDRPQGQSFPAFDMPAAFDVADEDDDEEEDGEDEDEDDEDEDEDEGEEDDEE